MSSPHLTLSQVAAELEVSRQYVSQLAKKGMPLDSIEAAKVWRAAHCPRAGSRATKLQVAVPVALEGIDATGETLEESIQRLRKIEKAFGQAVEAATATWSPELRQLQRDHIQSVKALSDAEIRLIRLKQKRGQLITIDSAKEMITAALSELILVIRHLPERGVDDASKALLLAVSDELLAAIRTGATKYCEAEEKAAK